MSGSLQNKIDPSRLKESQLKYFLVFEEIKTHRNLSIFEIYATVTHTAEI